MECAAIDTLVKVTKGNVDASHSTIFPTQTGMRGSSYYSQIRSRGSLVM